MSAEIHTCEWPMWDMPAMGGYINMSEDENWFHLKTMRALPCGTRPWTQWKDAPPKRFGWFSSLWNSSRCFFLNLLVKSRKQSVDEETYWTFGAHIERSPESQPKNIVNRLIHFLPFSSSPVIKLELGRLSLSLLERLSLFTIRS